MNATQSAELIAAKTRLTEAKADMAELKLAVMRKEFVSSAAVSEQWGEQVMRVKTRLLAMPVKLAGLLSGKEYASSEIEQIARGVVTEALEELSSQPEVKSEVGACDLSDD